MNGFSIIIPTYNADQELALAIESIKKNSRLDNELIVIVDQLKSGDISQAVLSVLKEAGIKPVVNSKNLGPYKNWNLGAQKAVRDWLVFATDDQYFAPGWDLALWQAKKRQRLLTGQMVEPGLIPVWKTNIKKDFGHNPQEFREEEFTKFAKESSVADLADDGFFVPLVVCKADFDILGGWPTAGEFGTRDAPANDIAFINKAKKAGFEFKRALNSFSYHFQGSSWRRKKLASGISVAIISRAEEAKINEVLDSVNDWVDEIVVVLDKKIKGGVYRAAQKFGAKIYYRDFDDYSSQKNFAISKAKGDWVLSLDADEIVSAGLAKELQEATGDLSYNGYYLPRKNIIFGKTINHTGWYPDYQLRFFVKDYGTFSRIIHERICLRGGAGHLKNPLVHYNYQTVSGFIDRLNRYTDAESQQLIASGYQFLNQDLVLRPTEEFFRRFFAQRGWQDGLHGLVLSALMAFYTFVIYLKAWESFGFKKESLPERGILRKISKDWRFWWRTFLIENENNKIRRFYLRVIRKTLS
ncbi:MAG: glycosyltransferase [Candidatus Shapirobacteria bacterium]|nr:glycosyltransferase [Candidatus Shapirobacteria bacterium]MDD5074044.1 glycosyltransferase [Candidatus Shapirobacteria bacterium]MDD5481763.1 glycosyltransferase [Candidatus Shapirobacteria bacterium]